MQKEIIESIDEALKTVGSDSIQHLFEFVELQCEMADNFYDMVETERMGLELGKAIYGYAENKERICRGSGS